MFELRREAAVAGHGSPAVVEDLHLVSAGIDHGPDGEDHARPKRQPFMGAAIMQHVWRLVEAAADAVAAEITHHAKALRLDIALNRVADVRPRGARLFGANTPHHPPIG